MPPSCPPAGAEAEAAAAGRPGPGQADDAAAINFPSLPFPPAAARLGWASRPRGSPAECQLLSRRRAAVPGLQARED